MSVLTLMNSTTLRLAGCIGALIIAASCKRSDDRKDRAPMAPQLKAADEVTKCAADHECSDLGRVCPVDCHLGIVRERWMTNSDALAVLRTEHAEREHYGDCRLDCTGPFFGLECRAGKCASRRERPRHSICYGNGARIECAELVKRFGISCERYCDGKDPDGIRLEPFPRIENRDGTHQVERYALDFIPCSECEELARRAADEDLPRCIEPYTRGTAGCAMQGEVCACPTYSRWRWR